MSLTFHPVSEIFPLMQGDEFADLVSDIKEHGLREPIWLHQDGRIIDGRNRYRACLDSGAEVRTQTYIGPDADLTPFVVSLNLHRRHLNESQRAMVAAKLVNAPAHRPEKSANLHSSKDSAELLNVSERTVKTARKVQEFGTPDIVDAVEAGSIAVSDAATIVDMAPAEQNALLESVKAGDTKNLKAAKRKQEIERQRTEIEAGEIVMPSGVFEVISIDPPWPYGNEGQYDSSGFRGTTPYPEMPLEDIAALDIPAADDCVLWLWTTHKFMRHSFVLLEAWGFEEKSILTWVKDRMGTGRWLRSQSEFCIMAVKGKPTIDLTNQTTVLQAPLRQHSRKPDEFYHFVESLCVGRRLDFFSREKREGWAQVGNDSSKFGDAA